jgi:hypothetical protein
MLVDLKDDACRECRGQLKIINADDATMVVECTQCGYAYSVEKHAFGDGLTYYVGFLSSRQDSEKL